MVDYLVVDDILVHQQYMTVCLQLKHHIAMLIYLFYHWITVVMVKIIGLLYDSIFMSIIEFSTYNSCIITIITIITTIAAITTYAADKIDLAVIKLIEFNVVNVSLAVYVAITSMVLNITNIYCVSQVLCSKKSDAN